MIRSIAILCGTAALWLLNLVGVLVVVWAVGAGSRESSAGLVLEHLLFLKPGYVCWQRGSSASRNAGHRKADPTAIRKRYGQSSALPKPCHSATRNLLTAPAPLPGTLVTNSRSSRFCLSKPTGSEARFSRASPNAPTGASPRQKRTRLAHARRERKGGFGIPWIKNRKVVARRTAGPWRQLPDAFATIRSTFRLLGLHLGLHLGLRLGLRVSGSPG